MDIARHPGKDFAESDTRYLNPSLADTYLQEMSNLKLSPSVNERISTVAPRSLPHLEFMILLL